MANGCSTNVKQTRVQSLAFVVAMGFCAVFAVIFGALAFLKGGHIDKIELRGSINPNNASEVSLVRLPGIGRSRAQAVVDYRQQYAAKGGQWPAFKDCNDLDKVKGIGPATIRKIKPWVEFK